jgi:hypothetical protein
MTRSKKKVVDPVSQELAAKAWVNRWVKDGFENRLGLVQEVGRDGEDLFLKATFIGKDEPQKIWLDPRPDGECLTPDMPKSRYRPAREDEVEALRNKVKSSKG